MNEFGDVIAEFAQLERAFTKEGRGGDVIGGDGYVTESYEDTGEVFNGVMIPRARFDFMGHGFELRGEVFLYVSVNQDDWPGLDIGDVVTDGDGITWKVVSFRNYEDSGSTKIYGLERDVK